LKFVKPGRAGDPESLRRFLQEAEVTSRLEHPGVVPIYTRGTDGSGAPCYAMRFIRGATLQDALDAFHAAERPGQDRAERSLALRDLLNRLVSVCNTVAYAHSRGILHRDLKPQNIMLGPYDETLVVDWGLHALLVRRLGKDLAVAAVAIGPGRLAQVVTVGVRGQDGPAHGQDVRIGRRKVHADGGVRRSRVVPRAIVPRRGHEGHAVVACGRREDRANRCRG